MHARTIDGWLEIERCVRPVDPKWKEERKLSRLAKSEQKQLCLRLSLSLSLSSASHMRYPLELAATLFGQVTLVARRQVSSVAVAAAAHLQFNAYKQPGLATS